MKNLTLFLILFLRAFITANAQSPQQMNYQAVVRANAGVPVSNGTHVSLRFNIHDNSPTGNSVYNEVITTTANQFGLVNVQIGTNNNLAVINWGNGGKYLQVEADVNNTGAFTDMGTTQLLSVPYALYAANSNVGPTGPAGINGLPGPTGPAGYVDTALLNSVLNGYGVIQNQFTALKHSFDSLSSAVTYHQADTSGIPYGLIAPLKGGLPVPNGWALCDGGNGTPDLRDKFIKGGDSTEPSGVVPNLLAGEYHTNSIVNLYYGTHSSDNYWYISDSAQTTVYADCHSMGIGDQCCDNHPYAFNLDFLPPNHWYAFTAGDTASNGWTNGTGSLGSFEITVNGMTAIPSTAFTSATGEIPGSIYTVFFFIPQAYDNDTYRLRYIMKL